MKKKVLSLILAIVLIAGVFSGVCFISANAEGSSNLFELYGYNPDFEQGVSPWTNDGADYTRTDDLSVDGDGYVFSVAKRNNANAGPQATVTVNDAGTYYYSYYVKFFDINKDAKIKMGVRFVVGNNTRLAGETTVESNTWTLVYGTIDLTQGQTVTLGIHQFDYSAENAPDFIVDNIVFSKFTSTNVLRNGGMETWKKSNWLGSYDEITYWSVNAADAERSTEKYEGSYSAKITNREQRYSGPAYSGDANEVYSGEGVYYYSFYAKCVNANDTCSLAARVVARNADFNTDTQLNGAWLDSPYFAINGSTWTKVEGFFVLPAQVNEKEITIITLQMLQPVEEANAICSGIYFDNFVFAKPSGYSVDSKNLIAEENVSCDEATQRVDVTASQGDYFLFVSNRKFGTSVPTVGGVYGKTIFDEQGTGEYTLSFDVKTLFHTEVASLAPVIEIRGNDASGNTHTQYIYIYEDYVSVTGSQWQTITSKLTIPEKVDGKYEITQVIFRPANNNFDSSNPVELLFDNFVLTKDSYITDTDSLHEYAERKPYSEVRRSQRTGIGAIYYQMWFKSLDEWWTMDSEEELWNYATTNDYNSTQEARSLSVAEYQFHLPFFATINTEITQSACTRGDLSKGVAEFPDFTQEIWTQEMEYAIDAGIDFMAYLWSKAGRPSDAYESAYQYHIKTKGLNNRIKMCAILQEEGQDLDTMVNAMTEKYWYTIDGMPVVYIYGGNKVATETFVTLIRRKLAIAQKAKYGAVGAPAYIIVMGNDTYENAQAAETLGVDATGWYGTETAYKVATQDEKYTKTISALNKLETDSTSKPTTIEVIKYSALARYNLQTIDEVAPITDNGNISVSPVIMLGYDTEARILNPVHWTVGTTGTVAERAEISKNELTYSGRTGELPTPEEMTEHVLNVLNQNKENASRFNANTVLIYAWNEFNEGGWFCPNLKFDENGNVVPGEVNREYLDAVKTAISSYRKHEAENATYDLNDNVITQNIQIPVYNDNTVKINIKGSIDAINLEAVTITSNGKKVVPTVDMQAGVLSCNVEKNSQINVSFSQMGVYSPISIQYAGVKGKILGTNEYSFTAYGNLTELDVTYEEIEGELQTVKMFYVNASGARVEFDSFIVASDVVEKINNYPQIYKKTFKAFNVDGVSCKTAEEAAALIVGVQTEIEVEYVDTVTASVQGYAIAKHENMTVTVNGEEVSAKVEPFALAMFTADAEKDGQAFSYWVDESGQPVSYDRVYMRYITGNVNISPVYGESVEKAAVIIKVADNEEKLVLIAERSISGDCKILEHGIIIAEYVDRYLDLDDVGENEQGKVYLGHRINNGGNVLNNGTYILTKGDKHSLEGTYSEKGTTLSFVAFVRYLDAQGNEQTQYSKVGVSKVIKAEPGPSFDFDEIE